MPIAELAFDVLSYLVFGAMVMGIVAAGVLLVSAPVAIWRGSRWYVTWLAKVALLVGCLWIWGLPGHLLFAGFARGRYYVPGDPLVDFLPFVLPGDWMIDYGHYVNGASAVTLYPWWAAVAVPTWLIAIYTYRHVWAGIVRPNSSPSRSIPSA